MPEYNDFNMADIYFYRSPVSKIAGFFGKNPDQFRKLIESYRKMISINPGYAPLGVGEYMYENNRLEEALPYLLKALEEAENAKCPGVLVPAMVNIARIKRAGGDPAGALEVLEECRKKLKGFGKAHWIYMIQAFRCRMDLERGDKAKVEEWLASRQLNTFTGVNRIREFELLVYARVLLAKERPHDGKLLLQRLLAFTEENARLHGRVEVLNLLALLDYQNNHLPIALSNLEKSLKIGMEEGYVRSYLDELTPMARLLRYYTTSRRKRTGQASQQLMEYAKDLLRQMHQSFPETMEAYGETAPAGMKELFTEQEKKVLELLMKAYTNQEIGVKLGIGLRTVKTHTANIYGKLGVKNRAIPGALPYAVHKTGIVLLLLSLLMASISTTFTDKLLWIRMYHSGTFIAMVAWLALTVKITGRERWLNRWTVTGWLIVLGTALAILFSSERYGLYWNRIWASGAGVREIMGVWGSVIIDTGYLVLLFCTCLFFLRFLRVRGILRAQAGIMVFSTVITISGYFCWRMGDTPAIRQDSLAMAFIISGLLDAFAFFKLRLFDIMPAAQAMVTQMMGDGLVVVDKLGIIVGVNSAAERIIGKVSPEVCGNTAGEVFELWPELSGLVSLRMVGSAELVINGEFYNVMVDPLSAWGVGLMGLTIVFHNISAEKKAQQLLIQQEQAAAIIKERDRLGRELHDGQGQMVSYLSMQLEAARSWIAHDRPAQADTLLKDLVAMTQGLHTDIRESITNLKSNGDQDGFLSTLSGYLEWFGRNYGIGTELTVTEEVREEMFSPVGAVQLQRIIQEALTNIRKHAGARRVRVNVTAYDNEIEIAVEDDGVGFDVAKSLAKQGNYGLKIMMERAQEIGASIRFDSRPQAGTSVKITVPIMKNL